MVVVDIRNVFTIRNVELIEVSNDFIYYAEEKREEGHNNLFLLEYNRVSRRERIVANYSLDDPTFVQHIFSFGDSIILLLENGKSDVWVFRVDKNTGQETACTQINCIGSFAGCKALDKRHILVYTVESEAFTALFREYKKITGCTKIAYLYDLNENKKYFVKNPLLCQMAEENLLCYQSPEGRQVVLLQPYGDEAFKEKCYREARWINGEIRDNVWLCPLKDLIASIQEGREELALKPVVTAGTNGLARYIGMDNRNLYFRAKHFPSGMERLFAYHKQEGGIQVLAELEPVDGMNRYYYIDYQQAKLYLLEEKEDTRRVKGVLNSAVDTEYEKKLGEFVGCIEDRFVISRKVINKEDGTYDFEYNSIYDSKQGTEESFECKCAIRGNTLVIY